MSLLSAEQVESFQELYRNRFGKDISKEEAYEQGVKLVKLMELVLKAMAVNQVQLEAHGQNTESTIPQIARAA
jgi:hypothetical protein